MAKGTPRATLSERQGCRARGAVIIRPGLLLRKLDASQELPECITHRHTSQRSSHVSEEQLPPVWFLPAASLTCSIVTCENKNTGSEKVSTIHLICLLAILISTIALILQLYLFILQPFTRFSMLDFPSCQVNTKWLTANLSYHLLVSYTSRAASSPVWSLER